MGFITAIRCSEHLKKAAGIFAGLGHLQPLLLVTTNANYLLDRFCMERCCSSEYVSRIVTSIIFMEILSIIVVRIILITAGTGLYTIMDLKTLGIPKNWLIRHDPPDATAKDLVEHTRKEEPIRDIISTLILLLISIGYVQIFYAFTTGGKKGHMHWFYVSLLIQHFLNSLIAGSIGFWEVGLALWYLVTLPMGPVIVFIYQLYIHSWIRNNGPRDAEYLVVENQIWLALSISCMATVFWSIGYVIPYISQYKSTNQQLNPTELALASTDTSGTNITNLKIWSTEAGNPKSLTIESAQANGQAVSITIHSITVETDATPPNDKIIVRPGKPVEVKKPTQASAGDPEVTAKVEASKNGTGPVTLTLTIYKKTNGDVVTAVPAGTPEILATRPVKDATQVNITSLYLALEYDNTKTIDVKEGAQASTTAGHSEVKGWSCSPYPNNYYFSGTSAGNNVWDEKWDGGRCFYAECYYNGERGTEPALLKLCILGNTLGIRYYGTTNSTGTDWQKIDNENVFSECVDLLKRTGTFTDPTGAATDSDPGDNPKFSMVFGPWNKPTATWAPLIMQGLSVGAVGSIFPNLIPKTLVCPKTSRTLTVINMFLVTVPHIINLALAENGNNPASNPWEGCWPRNPGNLWQISWSLYIIYFLAILFAIFNVHYPEWALSTFLRNNTWIVFLMILFTDVLNETFNAISRAGICSQKSAVGTKKNHPCLHNKIACLMNLTYIPFWMTTMDPYVGIL